MKNIYLNINLPKAGAFKHHTRCVSVLVAPVHSLFG